MKQALKLFGTAIIDLLTAILRSLVSVYEHHPKAAGIISAVVIIFLLCILFPAFLNFVAQIIALLMMGGLVYLIFFKKSDKPKPSQPRRNNNRRGR
jgi:hypothetical protein